jgi:EamA domain-containing membrane protein RarD
MIVGISLDAMILLVVATIIFVGFAAQSSTAKAMFNNGDQLKLFASLVTCGLAVRLHFLANSLGDRGTSIYPLVVALYATPLLLFAVKRKSSSPERKRSNISIFAILVCTLVVGIACSIVIHVLRLAQ